MSNLPPRPPAFRGGASRTSQSLSRRTAPNSSYSSRGRDRGEIYASNSYHDPSSSLPPHSSRHSSSSSRYPDHTYERERYDRYDGRYYDGRYEDRRAWDEAYERRDRTPYQDALERENYGRLERYPDHYPRRDPHGYPQDSYSRTFRHHRDTYTSQHSMSRRGNYPSGRDAGRPSRSHYSPSPSRSQDGSHRQSTTSHGGGTYESSGPRAEQPVSPGSRLNEEANRRSSPSSGEWSNARKSGEERGRSVGGAIGNRLDGVSTGDPRMRSRSRSPSHRSSPPVKIRRPPRTHPLNPTQISPNSPTPTGPKDITAIAPPMSPPTTTLPVETGEPDFPIPEPTPSLEPTPQAQQPPVQTPALGSTSPGPVPSQNAANTTAASGVQKMTDSDPGPSSKTPSSVVPKAPPTEPRNFRSQEALATRSQIPSAPATMRRGPPYIPKLRKRPLAEDLEENIAKHVASTTQAWKKINANTPNFLRLQYEGMVATAELLALEDRRKIAERQRISLEKGIVNIEAFDELVKDGLIEDLSVHS